MPHSLNTDTIKISIIGAAGGIGQSLSLLLKTQLHFQLANAQDKHIHLALYDVNHDMLSGVAADLSHIDTPISVSHHSTATTDGIRDCLINTDLILIPAGVPRKPGMTREDLLHINAKIIKQLADSIALYVDLSKAFILVISNPVNSLVPVMIERLQKAPQAVGTNFEKRVLGITNLDIVRASTFLHELNIMENNAPVSNRMPHVPVIGGHSGETIMPLFSLAQPPCNITKKQSDYLIHRVQFGGDEVVKAKNGQGSATLSMAHAAFKVVTKFIPLLTGQVESFEGTFFVSLLSQDNIPICESARKLLPLISNCPYFAVPVVISQESGIVNVDYEIIGRMSDYEQNHMLPLCMSKLENGVRTGLTIGSSE